VHAIQEQDWVEEMAATVRHAVEPGRHVHLVLEHHNHAGHLRNGIDAQWNDDGHNVLHALLTDEDGGYYADYADDPAARLARVLAEGWVYQGEKSGYLNQERGEPCADLPPTAHVLFLQNHDQIGNRAFGERLTALASRDALKAAIAIQLIAPAPPLLFMGEELGATMPFLFFCDFTGDLADAVRDGRRREFARFPAFASHDARERIPDPLAIESFERSKIVPAVEQPDRDIAALYRQLLDLRRREIVPRLTGARPFSARYRSKDRGLSVEWDLADGSRLALIANLAAMPAEPLARPVGQLIWGAMPAGDRLAAWTTLWSIETPTTR
jgi:malto-oligosyltrehalose trehalohydrolase